MPVAQLSVGQRQRAEILRTLDRGARVIVLDEPTAALTPGETYALFPGLRRLRDAGSAIVFISHKLEEIEGLADRVAVLRRGVLVAVKGAREADARELGSLMLGRDLPGLVRPPGRQRAEVVPAFALRDLEAPGLREASRLKGVSLAVKAGEIVGVAGIDGNGQRELEEVLAGVRPMTAGRIEVAGRPVAPGVRQSACSGCFPPVRRTRARRPRRRLYNRGKPHSEGLATTIPDSFKEACLSWIPHANTREA